MADAKAEIGISAWADFEELYKYLKRDPTEARYAASAVVRSETEFLGLSVPRFAIRVYLDKAQEEFLNCRRLELVAGALHTLGAPDPERAPTGARNALIYACNGPLEKTIVNESPCVADGLISPPPSLHDYFKGISVAGNFHIIKAPLGKAYGETVPNVTVGHALPLPSNEREIYGTPYAKTVNLSGGLCAQAACFIATAIHAENASGIFGLAEITAMIQGQTSQELAVGGITEEEMARYFEHVKLRCVPQFVKPRKDHLRVSGDYANAMRAYVTSNMPVILMVESSEMLGKPKSNSIYRTNGWQGPEGNPKAIKSQKHAVVLVGVHHSKPTFLLNDPSEMPFMAATAEQLDGVGYYSPDHEGKFHRLPIALPVTPKAVAVPLLNWIAPGASFEHSESGLIDYTDKMDSFIQMEPSGKFKDFLTGCQGPGRFFLTQVRSLDDLPERALAGLKGQHDEFKRELKLAKEKLVEKYRWLGTHWLWLEVRSLAIRIWNAERPLPTRHERNTDPDPDRVGNFFHEHLPVTIWKHAPGVEHKVHLKHPNLDLALISSFSMSPNHKPAAVWPKKDVTNVDLYAFMQRDLDLFAKWPAIANCKSVVCALAEAWKIRETEGDSFVKSVAELIKGAYAGLNIRSFASFIPEIAAQPRSPLATQAQDALKFLVHLAGELAQPGLPFPVEIVAGSLIRSVWRAVMRDETEDGGLGATLHTHRDALNLLLARLAPVAQEAAGRRDLIIQISIELEPGPLFNVNSAVVLRDLCDLLDNHCDPAMRKHVGVNLDIAHWAFLSRIHPHWLDAPENRCVRERIIHCHVSDHAAGHLSDNFIGSFHRGQFKLWMDMVAGLAEEYRGPTKPRFSGLMSLELEAVKTEAILKTSLRRLKRLMRDCYGK